MFFLYHNYFRLSEIKDFNSFQKKIDSLMLICKMLQMKCDSVSHSFYQLFFIFLICKMAINVPGQKKINVKSEKREIKNDIHSHKCPSFCCCHHPVVITSSSPSF